MAFDIANALQPATFNPSGVMQAVQSNRLAQAQDARAQAEATMRSTEFQNQLADRAAAQQQGDAKSALATAQYVLQSKQPKALLQSLSQTDPKVAEFLDAATAHHGIDWNSATDQDIRGMAQTLIAHYGSQLGQGPPVAKTESIAPSGSLVTVGQDASGNPTAAPLYSAPEAFTGAPTPMVLNGKPVMAVRGSAGTIRPIPGATPYQAPSEAQNKPQLVEVPLPDGTVQKKWVIPGQGSGTDVGVATIPSGSGGMTGGREATQINRMLISSSQAAKTLENIVKIPSSSSTGIFGGASKGTGLMSAGVATLANAMTSQEVQRYKPVIAGLTRSLAGIEAAGLMPNGTLTHQMDAVVFQEGDTELTKLTKLAEARQIVQEGIRPFLDNPRVSEPQKAQIHGFIDRLDKAIPFTQDDVTALQMSNNPKETINDIVRKRLTPSVNAQGWVLHEDANGNRAYVSPDGKQVQEVK